MDWWQVAVAASYPAGVLVEECVGLVGAPYPAGVLVGTSMSVLHGRIKAPNRNVAAYIIRK